MHSNHEPIHVKNPYLNVILAKKILLKIYLQQKFIMFSLNNGHTW